MVTKKIIITIRTLKESFKEAKKFAQEFDRGIIKKYDPVIAFPNFEMYKKFLTQKRLELLSVIKSKKPNSIKELAKMTQRDFKNVYVDIKILKNLDLVKLKKTNLGIVPSVIYDELDIKIPLEIKPRRNISE